MEILLTIKDFVVPAFSFLSVEPYPKNFILWVSGFCLLVFVAGGGIIKLNDKQIGNLGIPSRIVSGVLSIIFVGIYFLVPSPNLSINGVFSDATFRPGDSDQYEIRLTPQELVKKTQIGEEGIFKFNETHKITGGNYYITIIRNGRDVVFNEEYATEPDKKNLLVVKSGNGYKVSKQSPFDYFRDSYKYSTKNWMTRFRALRHLISMAKEEKKIKEKIFELMKSENSKEKNLAIFTLGGLGEEPALVPLQAIIKDNSNKYKIWTKLRAASQIWNYNGNLPGQDTTYEAMAYNYLKSQLLRDNIISNDKNITESVHRAAARHLAERNYAFQCVITALISGVNNPNSELSTEYIKLLRSVTNYLDNSTYDQWKTWWVDNKINYPVCTQTLI